MRSHGAREQTRTEIGTLLRERVGMDRLRAAWAACNERLPRDHGHLAMLDASMSYLRQFAPDVLRAVRFAGGSGTGELLAAVSMLTELYATGTRPVRLHRPGRIRKGIFAGTGRESVSRSTGAQ